jgi:aspartate/methionine/tyrosine aminotransferase
MFSRRTPRDLRPNALARLRARRGDVPFDLTVSNPMACGIEYPDGLLRGLADATALSYRPAARGLERARVAVAAEYRRHGVEVDPGRVVLTASTSEAYGFLFKLLCDPGDVVRLPAPSYPLFEHLTALEGVRGVPYRLAAERDWQPEVEGAVAGGVRAWLAVHPNNPTGSFVDESSARALTRACLRDGAALIVDEVFLDYPLQASGALRSFAGHSDVLTFTLGGLSKSVGLPQLKLAWIVVSGPSREVEEALARLELIADHYLSVGTPVQEALPELLAVGAGVREAIGRRCRANLDTLRGWVPRHPELTLLPVGGGWTAVLRYPSVVDEEALVLELLDRHGVAVHPGYFFDFPTPGYLVLSLLPPPPTLTAALNQGDILLENPKWGSGRQNRNPER